MKAQRWGCVRIVLLLVLCLGLVVLRGCVFRPGSDYPGGHFNQGRNAVWLGVEWVNQPHSRVEIAGLADNLAAHEIGFGYVFVTYLRRDGTFNPTYSQAEAFIDTLKAMQPDIKLLAWVGVPLQAAEWGYVDLRQGDVRQSIAGLGAELVALGFDGIHLDVEPIQAHDAGVLQLLEEIRAAIGTKPLLSIATPRIWPIFPEISTLLTKQIPAWDVEYYRDIARRVDQVAVMVYDSAMPTAWLYRHWVKFQVIEITQALHDLDVEVLMGVPASQEATQTHRPRAENMRSGLEGIIEGLNDKGAFPEVVVGVAIYPYWETTASDWQTYDSLWTGEGR